jgi:hypothetical protein
MLSLGQRVGFRDDALHAATRDGSRSMLPLVTANFDSGCAVGEFEPRFKNFGLFPGSTRPPSLMTHDSECAHGGCDDQREIIRIFVSKVYR